MQFENSHKPGTMQQALESAVKIAKTKVRHKKRDEAVKLLQTALKETKKDATAARQRRLTMAAVSEAYRRADEKRRKPLGVAMEVQSAAAMEDEFYMPRNRIAALMQSAMDRRMEMAAEAPVSFAADLPVGEPFSDSDPGWARVVADVIARFFRGNAKFVKHSSVNDFVFPIGDTTTISLFSDWGTGRPEAIQVASQIASQNPEHIIHLGDVYYAGEEGEFEKRFLANFPAPASLQSRWTLNGNHEMYSGGHGYFKKALPVFGPGNAGQSASYFALINANWRVIGLDSAYVDADLKVEKQLDWLAAQLTRGDGRKTILLTHHQPFSAFENANPKVLSAVKAHLDAGLIHAWFWGHEHKHVVFGKHLNTFGRCIGHGAIPYAPPPSELANTDAPVVFVNRRTPDGVHCVHGFAHLEFNDSALNVKYIDEDGTVSYQEDLAALIG